MEFPTLEKLQAAYREKGLVVLGIDDENPEIVRAFLKKNPLAFPTLLDTGEVAKHFSADARPTTIILDRKGRIAAQVSGSRDEQEFVSLLRKAGLR